MNHCGVAGGLRRVAPGDRDKRLPALLRWPAVRTGRGHRATGFGAAAACPVTASVATSRNTGVSHAAAIINNIGCRSVCTRKGPPRNISSWASVRNTVSENTVSENKDACNSSPSEQACPFITSLLPQALCVATQSWRKPHEANHAGRSISTQMASAAVIVSRNGRFLAVYPISGC